MNRRGFISLIAGAGGALVVPWRQLTEPVIVLPPRPRMIVPPMHYRVPTGHMVTLLADYHRPDAPIEYATQKWALAQAIYLGGERGWFFHGGEWMTERDRREFDDVMSGRREQLPGDALAPHRISTVILHR